MSLIFVLLKDITFIKAATSSTFKLTKRELLIVQQSWMPLNKHQFKLHQVHHCNESGISCEHQSLHANVAPDREPWVSSLTGAGNGVSVTLHFA